MHLSKNVAFSNFKNDFLDGGLITVCLPSNEHYQLYMYKCFMVETFLISILCPARGVEFINLKNKEKRIFVI